MKVTQEDREAAGQWCASQPFPSKQIEAIDIAAGEYDHHSLVQAFARHRTTALAAKEAELAAERAKVEKLREALTPSGDTKAAYHGEFSFQLFCGVSDAGIDQYEKVYVPWTTTKEIMAAIMTRATLAETQP